MQSGIRSGEMERQVAPFPAPTWRYPGIAGGRLGMMSGLVWSATVFVNVMWLEGPEKEPSALLTAGPVGPRGPGDGEEVALAVPLGLPRKLDGKVCSTPASSATFSMLLKY